MKIEVSRYALVSVLIVVATAVVAVVAERCVVFSAEIFAFPMNIVLMVLWLWGIVELYRRRQRSAVARYLLSGTATVLSVVLLAVGCIVMGLQRVPATESYLFMAMLLFVQSVLAMVTLRGWRMGGVIRWLFTASHVGLLLVLIAGFWGAPDTRVMRMQITAEPSREVYTMDGRRMALNYQLQLTDARIEYYKSGQPSLYEADIMVDSATVTLAVNHPYKVRYGEYIYLASLEPRAEEGVACIVQVVRQPWQGVMFAGIVLLIAGAVLIFFRGPRV